MLLCDTVTDATAPLHSIFKFSEAASQLPVHADDFSRLVKNFRVGRALDFHGRHCGKRVLKSFGNCCDAAIPGNETVCTDPEGELSYPSGEIEEPGNYSSVVVYSQVSHPLSACCAEQQP